MRAVRTAVTRRRRRDDFSRRSMSPLHSSWGPTSLPMDRSIFPFFSPTLLPAFSRFLFFFFSLFSLSRSFLAGLRREISALVRGPRESSPASRRKRQREKGGMKEWPTSGRTRVPIYNERSRPERGLLFPLAIASMVLSHSWQLYPPRHTARFCRPARLPACTLVCTHPFYER